MTELSIVTVSFNYEKHLNLNITLTRKLNPRAKIQWIVVDNSNSAARENFTEAKFKGEDIRILEGVPPVKMKGAGSFHHGLALNLGLKHVRNKFLLVIDPDFFVLRDNWISDVLEHMENGKLSFFGSVWHPKWLTHYRYFPSVHCFFVDTAKVPKESLDFTPEPGGGKYFNFADRLYLPRALHRILMIGAYKDTGWKIYDKFFADSEHRYETLTPFFPNPPHEDLAGKFVDRALKAAGRPPLSGFKPGSYATASKLSASFEKVHHWGWEEFQWRDALFALHMRNVARKILTGVDIDADLALLIEILRSKRT